MDTTYLIIYGSTSGIGSDRSPADYVAHIVYGSPRITAVDCEDRSGKGATKFVALCEYSGGPEASAVNAQYTYERMGSFGHGAELVAARVAAIGEFGSRVLDYASQTGPHAATLATS